MRSLFGFAFVLMLACLSVTQCTRDSDGPASSIDQMVAEIDAANLQTSTIEFACPDDPISGTWIARHREDRLVRLDVSIGYSHGGTTESFYFGDGGDLVYAEVTEQAWVFDASDPNSDNPGTIDTMTVKRHYLVDGSIERSFTRQARAASRENESIEDKIVTAVDEETTPADSSIVSRGYSYYDLHTRGVVDESWCPE